MNSCPGSSRHFNAEVVKRTAKRCRQRGHRHPDLRADAPPETAPRLRQGPAQERRPVGRGSRPTCSASPGRTTPTTGLFGGVNYLEIPRAITGVKARIVGLVGKYFPTGAHKVGAAFGCLVPRLVSGEFDPDDHKAVWPSTGNYCRGGAFDCALLGCTAIAILPERHEPERFEWLKPDRRARSSPRPAARSTSRRSTTSAGS